MKISILSKKLALRLMFTCVWIFSMAHPGSAFAGNITVSSPANAGAGSLRQAVSDANSGDTISFALTGVIELNTEIILDKNLSLIGPGADQLALSGRDSTRIFTVMDSDTVYVYGLTLRNGSAAYDSIPTGGAIRNRSFLSLEACVFYQNTATFGGAISNDAFGGGNVRLEILNCTFYSNEAISPTTLPLLKAGGAISSNGVQGGVARTRAANSTFSGNRCLQSGGGIYLLGDPEGGVSFEGINCTITGNAGNGGGGIDNAQAEPLVLKNCLIAGNLGIAIRPDLFGAVQSMGHNVIGDTGSVVLVNPQATDILEVDAKIGPLAFNGGSQPTHSLLCGSPAIDAGDDNIAMPLDQRGQARIGNSDIGAYERNPTLDILINNTKDTGAGSLRQALLLACPGESLDLSGISGTIHLASPLLIDKDISIIGNSNQPFRLSGEDSTRILEIKTGVTADISWMSLSQGFSELFGGGAIQNRGNLSVSYCTFSDNAAASGGAIANYGQGGKASLILSNCTFAENIATNLDGGAIDNRGLTDSARISITHCSFIGNQAGNKGGAIYNGLDASLSQRNTLYTSNSAQNEGKELFDESMGLLSMGYNLIANAAGSIFTPDSLDLLDVDALISPLGQYGGPTATYRLLPGSPAIDAGNNSNISAIDQRGEARIFNGTTDIGAYEYDPATSIGSITPLLGLYPNPSTGRFKLDLSLFEGSTRIRILNLNQQLVYQEIIQAAGGRQTASISLMGQPGGIYVIWVNDKTRYATGKLILK